MSTCLVALLPPSIPHLDHKGNSVPRVPRAIVLVSLGLAAAPSRGPTGVSASPELATSQAMWSPLGFSFLIGRYVPHSVSEL